MAFAALFGDNFAMSYVRHWRSMYGERPSAATERRMKFFRHLLCIALGSALVSACSKAPPPPPSQPASQSASQAGVPQPLDDNTNDGETLTAEVAAGGIPTRYVAHFEQHKLTRIDETRQANHGRGSYEFYGARLLRYSGAALDSAAPVVLEFSMTGSVEKAMSGDGPASQEQIESIRSRGQLLRSHALAQQSTRTHSPY
jgi:hypothetical protein